MTPVPYVFASCSRYICFVSEWQRDWVHTIVNAGRIWRYCDQENYFYHHHHTVIVSQLVMQLLTRSVSFLISSEEKDDKWIILSNWDVVSAEWSSCFTSHSLRLWAQQTLVFHSSGSLPVCWPIDFIILGGSSISQHPHLPDRQLIKAKYISCL